ncbi:MAG: hypothetical protein ACFFCW_20170 [Candidatus Hodarchaeota archaeon]
MSESLIYNTVGTFCRMLRLSSRRCSIKSILAISSYRDFGEDRRIESSSDKWTILAVSHDGRGESLGSAEPIRIQQKGKQIWRFSRPKKIIDSSTYPSLRKVSTRGKRWLKKTR